MNLNEINEAMLELDGWVFEGNAIVKSVTLENFRSSLAFVNSVGEIAEKFNHHPHLLVKQNIVKVILTTHSVGSLTKIDFDVAKEIDKLG